MNKLNAADVRQIVAYIDIVIGILITHQREMPSSSKLAVEYLGQAKVPLLRASISDVEVTA